MHTMTGYMHIYDPKYANNMKYIFKIYAISQNHMICIFIAYLFHILDTKRAQRAPGPEAAGPRVPGAPLRDPAASGPGAFGGPKM